MSMFILCACIMAIFAGCVPPGANTNTGAQLAPPWPGNTYQPVIPAGIDTVEAAVRDLADLFKTAQTPPGIKDLRHGGMNTFAEKEKLKALVAGKKGYISFWYDSEAQLLYMAFESILATDSRIEITPRIVFSYAQLVGSQIIVQHTKESPAEGYHIAGRNVDVIVRPYKVHIPSVMSFLFNTPAEAERFANDLFVIQQKQGEKDAERLALFERKAAEYRTLKVKPPVTEEQRKYIVQANALSQRKEYSDALDLYRKAVDIDPVSYPAAYFNMALLSGQLRWYKAAITYMKQYLMLEPDAKDARSAQDKIYEWELLMTR
jgi:tetratricopeptide (TPR) repeat protein